MKKALERIKNELYYYKNNEKIIGIPSGLTGNVSGLLRGDVSGLRGDVSGLRGDVSGLRGNVSGLRGNVSGLRGDVSGLLTGDVNNCRITKREREKGVNIADLVK